MSKAPGNPSLAARLVPRFFFGLLAAGALGLVALASVAARPAPPREAPELHADAWLNTEPLTMAGLRGRVGRRGGIRGRLRPRVARSVE